MTGPRVCALCRKSRDSELWMHEIDGRPYFFCSSDHWRFAQREGQPYCPTCRGKPAYVPPEENPVCPSCQTPLQFFLRPRQTGNIYLHLDGAGERFLRQYQFLPGSEAPEYGRPQTDLGLAERLARRHGHELRYAGDTWFAYDSRRWHRDDTAEVDRRIKETVRSLYDEAAEIIDDEERKEFLAWAIGSESNKRITAALARSKSEHPIPCRVDDFDPDPYVLNVQNGILDLRTGVLERHDPARMCTKVANVRYDRTAQCPTWLTFLFRIMGGQEPTTVACPDCDAAEGLPCNSLQSIPCNDRLDAAAARARELTAFLQRAVGYSLTGDTRHQCFFILYGTGANGKSTFLETIGELLGDYAATAESRTLMFLKNGHGVGEDLAALQGARLVKSSEVGSGGRWDEARIKSLTGGEQITCRRLYRDPFTFRPQFKIWFATNHLPRLDPDPGMMRRIRLIPFSVTIPEKERDRDLDSKLRAELPGILNWAIEGAVQAARDLPTPVAVKVATQEYGHDNDVVQMFLDEICLLEPGAVTSAADVYRAYQEWANAAGFTPRSSKWLGDELTKKGIRKRKSSIIWYVGISLRADNPPSVNQGGPRATLA